ncbi:MAG TPA: hypothetical protein VH391_08140 [Solirubrobacterales bacterium]
MAAYHLTIRHGSQVVKERFDDLELAIEAMEERVRRIRREGPLGDINALRDYHSGQRVNARLELSTGGFLRGREVGIDVMGDGALVPYTGVVQRRRLEPEDGASAFDAVRGALE